MLARSAECVLEIRCCLSPSPGWMGTRRIISLPSPFYFDQVHGLRTSGQLVDARVSPAPPQRAPPTTRTTPSAAPEDCVPGTRSSSQEVVHSAKPADITYSTPTCQTCIFLRGYSIILIYRFLPCVPFPVFLLSSRGYTRQLSSQGN